MKHYLTHINVAGKPRRSLARTFLTFALACLIAACIFPPDVRAASVARKTRRAVVLTTDVGAEMDDQWTLAHLLVAPELDLRGVVTTHAPGLNAPAAETTARVAREVLERIPHRSDGATPVFAGSSVPLADERTPRTNAAVRFLIEESRRFDRRRRLAVLVAGAATDVASALLIDPSLAERIEIVAMGFDAWPRGGDSWNVRNDRAAWRVLLGSSAPVVVGDAAVTRRDLAMTRVRAREMFAPHGATGEYLVGLLERWLDRDPAFTQQVTGQPDTWVIWDEVTTAYLLGMTRADLRPRPRLRDDLGFEHDRRAGRKLLWVTGVDAPRLWRHFTSHLNRAASMNSLVCPSLSTARWKYLQDSPTF